MSDKPPVEIEPHYQKRGANLVDILFDGKLFRDDLTRKDMQAIEDYVAFEFQSQVTIAVKASEMLWNMKARKK